MRNEPVANFMTFNPTCLQADATISDAHRMMGLVGCRHLPVLEGERLVGIVTQKGLYRLETVANIDRAHDPVTDAMDILLVVESGAPIGQVAAKMVERKVRAAIVVEQRKVVGIFTTTDALRALGRPQRQVSHSKIIGDAG